MRALLAAALALVAADFPAAGQVVGSFVQGPAASAPAGCGSGYRGPGDCVASAAMWWGLRAYSQATMGNDAIDIIRASDSATCTHIKTSASTGDLDIATTAFCTGGTQTVTQFCNATTCNIGVMYDQATGSFPISTASRPVLSLSCQNSKPCAQFSGTQNLLSIANWTQALPISLSAVAQRTGSFTSFGTVATYAPGTAGNVGGSLNFNNAANQAIFGCGTNSSGFTAADSTAHAFAGVCSAVNGSGVFTIDGTDNAGLTLGTHVPGAHAVKIGQDGFGDQFTGNFEEAGYWPVGFSSGDRASLHANQSAYWATP